MLQGESGVVVKFEALQAPQAQRHPPALKYMVTELLCSITGGLDLVTSMGFEGAKLGVALSQWAAFLQLTQATALEFFPRPEDQSGLLDAIRGSKEEFCAKAVPEERQSPLRTGRNRRSSWNVVGQALGGFFTGLNNQDGQPEAKAGDYAHPAIPLISKMGFTPEEAAAALRHLGQDPSSDKEDLLLDAHAQVVLAIARAFFRPHIPITAAPDPAPCCLYRRSLSNSLAVA